MNDHVSTNPLRTPVIPDGFDKLAPTAHTLTADRIWDHRKCEWVAIHASFIGFQAGVFTCVIRPRK